MFKKFIIAVIFAGLGFASQKALAADPAFTPAQKEELQTLIRDFLSENPEVIFESAQKYQEKQQSTMMEQAEQKIPQYKEFLEAKTNPSIGPKDAKVTVIEFFDFNCGYCKQAYHDIAKLSKEHPDVRFVFMELPILSPSSKLAAEWALAAHKQGKYFEYHAGIMEHKGPLDETFLKKLGADLKLDVARLEKDAQDPALLAEIEKNQQVAGEIGIRGTPGFIVNGKSYPGYLGEDGMKQAIKDAGG